MPPTKRIIKRAAPADNGDAPTKRVVKKAAAPTKAAPRKASAAQKAARQVVEPEEGGSLRSGWSASQETIDATSPWAANFKPETSVQIVKFIQGTPYASYRRHWIDRVGIGRRAYVCLESLQRPCPLCDVGDRPSAVSAFNIVLVGDDGEGVLKSWDCGVKITQMLKTFSNDPKIGPLHKPSLYFAVSKTETSQRQQAQTMAVPVRARDVEEDYGVPPLSDEDIERFQGKAYTNDIVQIPRASELEEIAAEMLNEDGPAGGGGWG